MARAHEDMMASLPEARRAKAEARAVELCGAVEGFTPAVLTDSDREAAADLLADAFFDNPAHTFI